MKTLIAMLLITSGATSLSASALAVSPAKSSVFSPAPGPTPGQVNIPDPDGPIPGICYSHIDCTGASVRVQSPADCPPTAGSFLPDGYTCEWL